MNYLIRDMLAIANEKCLQMQELLELTKEQTELFAEGNVEMLERYLVYKQNIIDRVNALDERYKELHVQLLQDNNVRSIEDLSNDSGVQEILQSDSKTKRIIREVVKIDKGNTETGKQLLNTMGEALKHANQAPAASRAYQGGLSGAIFVNRQG